MKKCRKTFFSEKETKSPRSPTWLYLSLSAMPLICSVPLWESNLNLSWCSPASCRALPVPSTSSPGRDPSPQMPERSATSRRVAAAAASAEIAALSLLDERTEDKSSANVNFTVLRGL